MSDYYAVYQYYACKYRLFQQALINAVGPICQEIFNELMGVMLSLPSTEIQFEASLLNWSTEPEGFPFETQGQMHKHNQIRSYKKTNRTRANLDTVS